MIKVILWIGVILLVILGWNFLGDGTDDSGSLIVGDDSSGSDSSEGVEDNTDSGSYDVLFVLEGENFKFMKDGVDNPELKVNEGDVVRVEFTSVGGFHDFVLDEFSAATKQVNVGGSTFVEFVADRKGSFEYYCSVGSHRQAGMKGMFVVE